MNYCKDVGPFGQCMLREGHKGKHYFTSAEIGAVEWERLANKSAKWKACGVRPLAPIMDDIGKTPMSRS